MLGADVEELRALARDFAGSSQKLAQAQRTLDGAVNQLPRYWQGPDAQRFASQWRGQHRGVISRTAAMLDDTADLLKKNATEQEHTSAVASLGGPSGVPGTGTGGTPGGGANPWGPDWLSKGFFAETPQLFKGGNLEWLGKGGLGRGLGWLGVGLIDYDTIAGLAEGDMNKATISGATTALGVACFLPPPAGTVAQVISVGWAVYDIPVVHDFVNNKVKAPGDGIASAVTDPGKFASDVGDGIKDLGKGAAKFLGFG